MQQPLRIAVAGTYSSGKTTLAGELARTLGILASTVEEQPRRVIRVGGNNLMRDSDVRSYLIVSQLLREHELSSNYVQIADGGIINNLAHDALFLAPTPSRTKLMGSLGFRKYDVAFICDPAGVGIEMDGERFTDPSLRSLLAAECVRSAGAIAQQTHFLSGPPGERLARAVQIVWQELSSLYAGSVFDKSAGLVLRDKRLLVVRKKAHPKGAFIPPGGRIEPGETPLDALTREIREELRVEVVDPQLLGHYFDLAEFERTPLRMHAYQCRLLGEPLPDHEIQEAAWMDHAELKKAPLGSILENKIVPALHKQGLL